MEDDIVTYMENTIKGLEEIKRNSSFFQKNEELLTKPLSDLFIRYNLSMPSIPYEFIMRLHKLRPNRNIYVFDVLDINNTKGRYPDGMDKKKYLDFLEEMNALLKNVDLSTSMQMSQEQREYFDKVVRSREESIPPTIKEHYIWHSIIRDIIYSYLTDAVREYLEDKHAILIEELTSYVYMMCEGKRLDDEAIKDHIRAYLATRNLQLFNLREFNLVEIEVTKKKRRK